MKNVVLNVPAMYGDHHVIEVRRIMLELTGVQDVYASSYLKTVEVSFDPSQITEEAIRAKLDKAGYLREPTIAQETGNAAYGRNQADTFFRHTIAYAQTGKTVSFAQDVAERPLIPCPGMDYLPEKMED
jgi:copper chaperone CopZ